MDSNTAERFADIVGDYLDRISERVLTSPNVMDSNLEAANLVDTTDKIARGLFEIAKSLDHLSGTINEASRLHAAAVENLAIEIGCKGR